MFIYSKDIHIDQKKKRKGKINQKKKNAVPESLEAFVTLPDCNVLLHLFIFGIFFHSVLFHKTIHSFLLSGNGFLKLFNY